MDLQDVKTTVEPYLNKLVGFQSSREIADFLAVEGVRARKGAATSCAIAEYVQQGSGQRVYVAAEGTFQTKACDCRHTHLAGGGSDGVIVRRPWHSGELIQEHSSAMTNFIQDFDNGEYPELEETS